MNLRPVEPEDRPFLLRVYASTREDELRPVPWSAEQKEAFVRQQFEAQDSYYHGHYEGVSYDVIEVHGRPAGRFYVARWPEEIHVMDIALLPEYRARGIGTALMRGALEEGARTGRRVTVHVEQFNPARRLYERLGFRPVRDEGIYVYMEWLPQTSASQPNTAS